DLNHRLIDWPKIVPEKIRRERGVIIDIALTSYVPHVSPPGCHERDRRLDQTVRGADPTRDKGAVMRHEGLKRTLYWCHFVLVISLPGPYLRCESLSKAQYCLGLGSNRSAVLGWNIDNAQSCNV